MSWQIHASGTVGEARLQVEASRDRWRSVQFDDVRALVLHQLDLWPVGRCVLVDARGHNDIRHRRIHIDITDWPPAGQKGTP